MGREPTRISLLAGCYVGRAVGLRPPRGVALSIPFGPFREHSNRWPLRLTLLWSVLLRKTIPPRRPPSRPLIPFACSRRAKLLNAHAHDRGIISSGLAPECARVKDRKTFRHRRFSGYAAPARWVHSPAGRRSRKTFAPSRAGGFAVPDPNAFGFQTVGMPPQSCGGDHHKEQTV